MGVVGKRGVAREMGVVSIRGVVSKGVFSRGVASKRRCG